MRLYDLAFQLFKLFPAELTHEVVFGGLRTAMALPVARRAARRLLAVDDPALQVRAFGSTFAGPLGLAAGFDKNAKGPDALGALGFAFVEIGTVTALDQPGNAKPRLFRLPEDRAVLNRMGFNNEGALRVAARLAARTPETPVAVNIGKTKVVEEADAAEDYARSAELLGRFASFVVVNVSSPNTPGLRNLQRVDALAQILDAVRTALDRAEPSRRVPMLVKIAPDLADEEVDNVADLVLDRKVEGIVATNTTIGRLGLSTSPHHVAALGAGGVSGPLLRARSLELLSRLYGRVGRRATLISVGGLADAEDAWDRITRGATLLELYTSFIYEGPLVARKIHAGLSARLRREGLRSIEDAIGIAAHARP